MREDVFNAVVSKVSLVQPMFAKSMLLLELKKQGLTIETVTPGQMLDIVNEKINPMLAGVMRNTNDVMLMGAAVIQYDNDGVILFMNPMAKRICEQLAPQSAGALDYFQILTLSGLIVPFFDGSELMTFRRPVLSLMRNFIVTIVRTLDSQLLPTGAISLIQDSTVADAIEQDAFSSLTALKASHQQLSETTSQLVQASKLTALGEFAAGICHEINQPLNVMKIVCDSAIRDITKERANLVELKKDFENVVAQITRTSEIIDHMRLFTRTTAENSAYELHDLNSLVTGALKFVGAQLMSHQIELVRTLTPDLPKISCDAIRLEQAFLNLVGNARVSLESYERAEKKIEVITRKAENPSGVVIEVRDNGPGIPEEIRAKIFEPFFTTRKEGKGTGLGLSIVTKIVDEHKGKIELESTVGEGTTFRLVLPV
ncbi:ATP-binding protein [Bdellovibrionota bacterium FG-2]